MIVVLTGAPGAGKGTQAELLAERMGFRKVSTGDALRRHIKSKTEIGLKAESLIAAGKLVPDDVMLEILQHEIGGNPKEKVLLDGYPRNVDQAKTLKAKLGHLHPVKVVVHLDVDRDDLVDRISGRRVCGQCGRSFHLRNNPPAAANRCDHCSGELSQRPDDLPEKVAVRLDVYDRETTPILEYYRREGIYNRVDGSGDLEDVFTLVKQPIESVLAH